MSVKITKPRGTNDVLPSQSAAWQAVEGKLITAARRFGYSEIRTPVFEATELFARGVGDGTDVVNKEMYTFEDRGGRSISLRPEGTAGVVRAAIENGLLADALPRKVCYLVSCFRYEKPQSGRYRQFHQFGVEMFGADAPAADAEVICMVSDILRGFGLAGVTLELNSIGCPACRAEYHKALRAYFEGYRAELCPTCQERLDKNPMRILDCKNPECREIASGAPVILDYLCPECRAHFEAVKDLVAAAGIAYTVNPTVVRGLDYYTRTVFEFSVPGYPALCGGGRYGGLVAELGGPDIEGVGFAIGLERLLALLSEQGLAPAQPKGCDVYLASMGEAAGKKAFLLAEALRRADVSAQCDLCGRSVKAQMKYADKLGARYAMVIGDDELAKNEAELKEMAGERRVMVELLDDSFTDAVRKVLAT